MDLPLWGFVSIGFEKVAAGQLLAVSQWMKYSLSLCSWFPGREAASLAAGRANEVVRVPREDGFSAEEPRESCSGRLAGLQTTPVRCGKSLGWRVEFACGLIFSVRLMERDSQPV